MLVEIIKCVVGTVGFLADFFTIWASGIAIYLFIYKSDSIKSVITLLLNYSYHLTLSELKEKLEKLNDFQGDSPEGFMGIKEVLSDLKGQIKGNDNLLRHLQDIILELDRLLKVKDHSREFHLKKRSFTSELREKLKNLNVKNLGHHIGD
jgi:hypothetical protein